eukprot:scaffold96481_cov32-Tisochrysis_lutea.AAC.1
MSISSSQNSKNGWKSSLLFTPMWWGAHRAPGLGLNFGPRGPPPRRRRRRRVARGHLPLRSSARWRRVARRRGRGGYDWRHGRGCDCRSRSARHTSYVRAIGHPHIPHATCPPCSVLGCHMHPRTTSHKRLS